MKLSAPTCGVEIRKETTEPLEAPLRLREVATGTTPHEQSGNGIPNSVDFRTEPMEPFPR